MDDPFPMVSASRHRQETTHDPDRKLRWFLVIWVAILMLLSLIVFGLTNNAALLPTTTIMGIPVSLVYNYYFGSKRRR